MSDLRIQKMQPNTGHLAGALQGKVKRIFNGGKSQPPNKQINKAHGCHAQDLRAQRQNKWFCQMQDKFVM
jgi:hypothetical protein